MWLCVTDKLHSFCVHLAISTMWSDWVDYISSEYMTLSRMKECGYDTRLYTSFFIYMNEIIVQVYTGMQSP